MFVAAVEEAAKFTRPVVTGVRTFSGTVEAGLAAYTIVNDEGWIVTAAHVLDAMLKEQQDATRIAEYERAATAIDANAGLSAKQRRRKKKALAPDPKWLTHAVYAWGKRGETIDTFHMNRLADLAIGQLRPFDPGTAASYPVFMDPSAPMPRGRSLCRIGYPFNTVEVTFDAERNHFHFHTESLPLFPIDGIHTWRKIVVEEDGNEAKYLEISTPGLRGQSGGPLVDVSGVVWGIQSHTDHFPLGFSPSIKVDGKEVVEHQYLNVGQAAHVEEVIKLFDMHGVRYQSGRP